MSDKPFDSGLVYLLAVLGYDQELDRLRRVRVYSFMLAGLVYCIRVLAAEVLIPLNEP